MTEKLTPIQEIMGGMSAELSGVFLGLAHGKYQTEIAAIYQLLDTLAVTVPAAGLIKEGLQVWLKINEWTAPAHVMPDGQGGYVPTTNSRYDPKTGMFVRA